MPGRWRAGLTGQQAFDDFGREGGEGGQAAQETRDGEQFPGQREMRVQMKTPTATPPDSRRSGWPPSAERQRDEQRIQRQAEQPAHPGPEGGAQADGRKFSGMRLCRRDMPEFYCLTTLGRVK
jgi:hypothetical protein